MYWRCTYLRSWISAVPCGRQYIIIYLHPRNLLSKQILFYSPDKEKKWHETEKQFHHPHLLPPCIDLFWFPAGATEFVMCQGLEAYPAAAAAAAALLSGREADATGGGAGFKRREAAVASTPPPHPPSSRQPSRGGKRFPITSDTSKCDSRSLRWRTGGERGCNREQVKQGWRKGFRKTTVISLCKHQHQVLHHALSVFRRQD